MQKNKLNLRICGVHLLNPYKTVVSHLKLPVVLGRPVELCMDESANFKVHFPEKLSKLQVRSIIKTLKVKHSVYFRRTQSFSSFRIHVIIASFLLALANSLQMFFLNSLLVLKFFISVNIVELHLRENWCCGEYAGVYTQKNGKGEEKNLISLFLEAILDSLFS